MFMIHAFQECEVSFKREFIYMIELEIHHRDFPSGPVVKTAFECRRGRFNFWIGNTCPAGQPKKERNTAHNIIPPHNIVSHIKGLNGEIIVMMEDAQSCLALCDPTDYTVHGIL